MSRAAAATHQWYTVDEPSALPDLPPFRLFVCVQCGLSRRVSVNMVQVTCADYQRQERRSSRPWVDSGRLARTLAEGTPYALE